MSLRVEVHSRLEDIDADQWQDLLAHCPDSTVFQSRAWLAAWLRTVGRTIAEPRIVAAYEGKLLAGVAPMWRGADPDLPDAQPVTRFIGAWHADYLTFPARDGSPQVLDALLDGLERALPADEPVELAEIPGAARLAARLAQRAGGDAALSPNPATPCPYLRIAGNADFTARVLNKQSLRRHARKLRALGELSVEHLAEPEAIEPLLEGFFEQHLRRWSATSSPSLFRRAHNREFYRELLRDPGARGALLFSVVRIDGRVVAQHFGLRSRRDLLWYKPAFDIELAPAGPGEVLLAELVRHAQLCGYDGLDFTRGDEAFKARFASETRHNVSFDWYRGAANRGRAALLRRARRWLGRQRTRLIGTR